MPTNARPSKISCPSAAGTSRSPPYLITARRSDQAAAGAILGARRLGRLRTRGDAGDRKRPRPASETPIPNSDGPLVEAYGSEGCRFESCRVRQCCPGDRGPSGLDRSVVAETDPPAAHLVAVGWMPRASPAVRSNDASTSTSLASSTAPSTPAPPSPTRPRQLRRPLDKHRSVRRFRFSLGGEGTVLGR